MAHEQKFSTPFDRLPADDHLPPLPTHLASRVLQHRVALPRTSMRDVEKAIAQQEVMAKVPSLSKASASSRLVAAGPAPTASAIQRSGSSPSLLHHQPQQKEKSPAARGVHIRQDASSVSPDHPRSTTPKRTTHTPISRSHSAAVIPLHTGIHTAASVSNQSYASPSSISSTHTTHRETLYGLEITKLRTELELSLSVQLKMQKRLEDQANLMQQQAVYISQLESELIRLREKDRRPLISHESPSRVSPAPHVDMYGRDVNSMLSPTKYEDTSRINGGVSFGASRELETSRQRTTDSRVGSLQELWAHTSHDTYDTQTNTHPYPQIETDNKDVHMYMQEMRRTTGSKDGGYSSPQRQHTRASPPPPSSSSSSHLEPFPKYQPTVENNSSVQFASRPERPGSSMNQVSELLPTGFDTSEEESERPWEATRLQLYVEQQKMQMQMQEAPSKSTSSQVSSPFAPRYDNLYALEQITLDSDPAFLSYLNDFQRETELLTHSVRNGDALTNEMPLLVRKDLFSTDNLPIPQKLNLRPYAPTQTVAAVPSSAPSSLSEVFDSALSSSRLDDPAVGESEEDDLTRSMNRLDEFQREMSLLTTTIASSAASSTYSSQGDRPPLQRQLSSSPRRAPRTLSPHI
eukprot:GILK01007676.1.p1 GENE.GILK01007676.1~~GILK01007676.1.p1  ORF type:complete len:634 (+),score=134.22 GILK01007676.1:609-2510(+)